MELYLFSFLVTPFWGDFFGNAINSAVKDYFREGCVAKQSKQDRSVNRSV